MQAQDSYSLIIESNESTVTTGTTYRFYVEMVHSTDMFSAVFGHNDSPLTISAPAGVFNSEYNASWSASGLNPSFLPMFPDMAADSFATIGLDGPASSSGDDGAADPSLVEDTAQPLSPFFEDNGSTSIEINTVVGCSYYVLNTASNNLAGDDLRVLIMQVTTSGSLSGTVNYQVFPLGVGADAIYITANFSEGGGEVVGCMIEQACNYDPLATISCSDCCDFESCLSLGCTDNDPNTFSGVACNYDPEAEYEDGTCVYAQAPYDCDGVCVEDADGDGVCDVNETYGCTDTAACNYDETASEDDGNCTYAEAPYDCFGLCVNDVNANGICDELEGPGCTDPTSCNYDPLASVDDGSCVTEAYGLDVDVVMEHTTGDLAGQTTYRLYVTTPHTDDFLVMVFGDATSPLNLSSTTSFYQNSIWGGFLGSEINPAAFPIDPDAEYDSWLTIGLDQAAGDGETDPTLTPGYPISTFESGGDLIINDIVGGGVYLTSPDGSSNGVSGADQRVLVAQLTTDGIISGTIYCQMYGNSSVLNASQVELSFNGTTGTIAPSCGCTDITACNYDSAATNDDGSCTSIPDGACDCAGNMLDECGICGGGGIADGDCDCAGNVLDDCGVCGGDNSSCTGCIDDMACNYDMNATIDDSTCIYPAAGYDCAGDCLADADGDLVCDDDEVVGCTDITACNYDVLATDDGDCTYVVDFYDCAGDCLNDTDGDGVCDELEVVGCSDITACNYDALATDDGDCTYAVEFYDCNGVCLNDTDGDGVCDELEVVGCTDSLATNYSMDATDDDGSCCYLVITLASITYENGVGVGTVTTDGGVGEVTIVWTDSDGVVVDDPLAIHEFDTYTVTVTDENGCTASSEVTQTGLNDLDPLAFGMFPNPTTGAITLQVSTEMHDVNLQVFDATGRVVFTQSNLIVQGSISLDFSNLSSGTYTIMLNNNNGVSVRRLSIQH